MTVTGGIGAAFFFFPGPEYRPAFSYIFNVAVAAAAAALYVSDDSQNPKVGVMEMNQGYDGHVLQLDGACELENGDIVSPLSTSFVKPSLERFETPVPDSDRFPLGTSFL